MIPLNNSGIIINFVGKQQFQSFQLISFKKYYREWGRKEKFNIADT